MADGTKSTRGSGTKYGTHRLLPRPRLRRRPRERVDGHALGQDAGADAEQRQRERERHDARHRRDRRGGRARRHLAHQDPREEAALPATQPRSAEVKRTARNAPRYAAAPPAAVKEAAASLWDVKLSADRLGRGMDGSIYQVTRGNAGGLVAKFMRASEWGKAEAALTDLILVEQRTPDSSANPYRVIFPAVVEGLILMDAREKPAWYVTLREDVEPVQAVHEEKCSDGDMRSCALLRATNELWDATDSFFYSATAEEPDKAEESLDDALAHVERAERDAPAAM